MPVVEVREVAKCFGDTVAVEGLSFSAQAGEALCLFGPSGCGKTTTLRLIAGLEQPERGAVWVDGQRVNGVGGTTAPRPGTVGMVFQDLALWPHMRVRRHVDFVLRGAGLSRKQRHDRVRRVLETCRMWAQRDAFPAALSGGEQQRLAIARAIAANPSLLLLDEPFANLDATLRDRFLAEFRRRTQHGTTIVFATHDRAEADALADKVLLMEAGQYRMQVWG